MASSTILSFKPTISIRAEATGSGGSGSGSRPASARSPSWWTPLFGWSSNADYVSHQPPPAPVPAKRFGVFTEEKARELRKLMIESETYHDAMYHSAIASRLASKISRGKGLENN